MNKKHIILLFIIIFTGIFLRLNNLDKPSIWMDEGWSVYFAEHSVSEMPSVVAREDKHPLFYYLLLHYWMKFKRSEFNLRLLSVLFGIMSMVSIYFFGRHLFNPGSGLMAAFLLSLSAFNIIYTQEARMYPLATFLGILVIYFLWRSLKERNSLFWAGYSISSLLLLQTHYLGIIFLFTVNLGVLLDKENKRSVNMEWKVWSVANLACIIPFLFWIPILLQQLQTPFFQHSSLSWKDFVDLFFSFTAGFSLNFFTEGTWYLIALAGLILAIIGLFNMPKEKWLFLGTVLFGCIVIPYLVAKISGLQVFEIKYMSIFLPLYYITVARGILFFRSKIVIFFLVLLFLALNSISLFNFYNYPEWQRQDWRGAINYVEKAAKRGDAILLVASYTRPAFDFYYKMKLPVYSMGPKEVQEFNLELVKRHRRIWLIRCAFWLADPGNTVKLELDRNFKLVAEKEFYTRNIGFRIWINLYETK